MDEELKPCPFCGGKIIAGISQDEDVEDDEKILMIECDKCEYAIEFFDGVENGVKTWNTRP